MGSLILTIAVIGVGLGVLFYVGSLFLQGYIYTEPSAGLFWQAPAAALVLVLFLLCWCMLVANSSTAAPGEIPYDVLLRFSDKENLTRAPLAEITAIRKNGEAVTYKTKKGPDGRWRYYKKKELEEYGREVGWDNVDLKAIRVKFQNEELVLEAQPRGQGDNRHFVHSSSGYSMTEFDTGPDGILYKSRFGLFLVNLLLNLFHLALWFVCLWLLLRFQWPHALGLAAVFWVGFSLVLMPMLLDNAASVAQERRRGTGANARMHWHSTTTCVLDDGRLEVGGHTPQCANVRTPGGCGASRITCSPECA